MGARILITGAGGFIGSHLAEACVRRGWAVRAFVHYNGAGRWGWLDTSPLRGEMEITTGDVRDYDAVLDAVKGCGIVFHLAALIGIPYSYRSPLAYIRTNVEGTYNVLQAAREEGAQVLVTSTSETYGTARYVPIDEEHPLQAQSPYAASKIAADQLALSFHRSFGLPVKVVRPFNTYGPRQSARAVIPTIVTQLLDGDGRIRLGNLSPRRDLTFVRDTVRGFLALAASPEAVGRVTNIGTGTEIGVGDLARRIASSMGRDVSIEEEPQRVRRPESEVMRLCCDNGRLTATTDWRPEYDLDRGLRETIAWLERHRDRSKSGAYAV